MTNRTALAVAARFCEAMERRDADLLAALYSEDAVIWHSHDEIEQSKDEGVATARAFFATLRSCSVELTALQSSDTGFVQQHRLVGERLNGRRFRGAPLCVIAAVRDGRIVRIDEYVGLKPRAA
ncbi:nuclear transport factor 2 family protein [Sphingomonas colocasiae]|uniref:Nuclear transport factor 2 family protein n=1 Tax=Sphingomonas colocasiae TaxID=1848973 RepID=A0ABS7PUI0_9SPHN|nr:nuclear transport factor 2 family protein [Sphingomonas colocasiae]